MVNIPTLMWWMKRKEVLSSAMPAWKLKVGHFAYFL